MHIQYTRSLHYRRVTCFSSELESVLRQINDHSWWLLYIMTKDKNNWHSFFDPIILLSTTLTLVAWRVHFLTDYII